MAALIRSLFTVFTLLILSSCTRPIGLRPLPEGPRSRASKIVLDDNLTAADVKELLEALNEHGDLEGVATYWRDPSEAELDQWGDWLSDYLVNPAGDPRGLVAAIDRWTDSRRMSGLEKDMREWRAGETFFEEREFLFETFRDDNFNALFERDYRLFNPSIWSAWSDWWEASDVRISKERFKVKPLVTELERVLTPALREDFEKVLSEAAKKHAVPSLFDTAKYYRDRYGLAAFLVLETGLQRMLRTPPDKGSAPKNLFSNQLEQLVAFTASANQSSHHMFLQLEKKLAAETQEGEALTAELEKWAVESLSELDSENALESAHRALSLVPVSMFRSLKQLLLGRFKLGTLGPLERAEITEMYPGEENRALRVMLKEWMNSVQSVGALDYEDVPGGPTLFAAYRDLLRRTASEDVGWLSSFYAWAHSGKFFQVSKEGVPHSEFWHSLINAGHGVQILRTVSALPERPRIAFREALQEALRGSDAHPTAGVALHLEWLKRAIKQRTGFEGLLVRFFDSETKNPLLLDEADWQFVERFALEAGQRFPRDFFVKHSNRDKAHNAVKALLKLAERGELTRPIALLAHVDSPSIERIAKVLEKANASGELTAALRTLDLFFEHPGAVVENRNRPTSVAAE